MLDWMKAEDLSFEVALADLLAGDTEAAEREARETVEYCNRVRPANSVFFYDALGRLYLEDGKLDHALATYRLGHESVVATNPEYPDDKLRDGRFVHAQGRIAAKRAGSTKRSRERES